MAIFQKTEPKKEESKTSTAPKGTTGFAGILIQPRLSEKSAKASEKGKYTFKVTNKANKIEVKKAIERFYSVKVVQVNMVVMKGKIKNTGRISGRTGDFKKAIVTLRKGDKIEVGEGI